MAKLRIAGVVRESAVDGPGLRFAIFCQGCPHDCPGCHNPATHDFGGGYELSTERLMEEIAKNPLLRGVTFSGGEPFCQAEAFAELARKIKGKTGLDIIVYSGYTYEELREKAENDRAVGELLDIADYLIDGRFVLAERDLTLEFRGSRNQRYIDMNATREKKCLQCVK